MNSILRKHVGEPSFQSKNNIVINVNKEFIGLTGFTMKELLGKSITELGNMLRITSRALLENSLKDYDCYIFTKTFDVKEVSVSFRVLDCENENICYFKIKGTLPFEESFPYIKYLLKDNKFGIAIYSTPDLVLLTANQKFLSLQNSLCNSIENNIGKKIKDRLNASDSSSAEAIFKEIIKTGNAYYDEEFEYKSMDRGITYWDRSVIPVSIDGKVKYLFETVSEVTERVLRNKIIEEQNKEIEDQKEFIRKQREQLEAIIKGLGDEIVIADKNGTYVVLSDFVNNQINVLDKNYQQVYDKVEFYDLAGNIVPLNETSTARALKGEKVKNLKLKTIKDGKIKYIQNTSIPIFNKNNELEFVINITHDITEIVEQGKKIEEQKKELEAIFENISDGISIIDHKGQYKLFNKNAREMFLPPKEFLGDVHDWYKNSELSYFNGDKIPPENYPENRILRGEIFSKMKVSAKFPNKLVHLDVSGTPIYDNEGNFILGVICNRDITEYSKQEEILKSRNEFLNRLIDKLELPVIGLSCPDLKVLKINQKAFDIINIFRPDIESAVKIKGNIITDIITCIKDDEYIQIINEVIKDKETKYLNKKAYLINENEVYWNVIFEPIFALDREISEILVLIIDITAEIKSNKIMEKALKSQEEFLANISHELKTPLNVIYSTIQLFDMYCKNGSLDQNKTSVFRYINSMVQNCYRLSKLINNIVDLSKIKAGFFELNMSNNDIVQVVEEIVMSVTDYTDIKGLSIIFDTDIEEKIIACDPEMIERIVLNLISNAIKFSDTGNEIFVNIEDKNEFIEISVKDNGIGIEDNQLDMIFNRFKQVDKSLSRNAEGTGIGLSLVKALVEMHQGRVYVQSELGKGSTFTVVVPSRELMQENVSASSKITLTNKTESLQVELSDICY